MATPVGAGIALLRKPGSKSRNTRKSSIYARFCVFPGVAGVILRLRGGHAASNQGQKTSVAGTAMQETGHDKAQRGQNPGITQNRA